MNPFFNLVNTYIQKGYKEPNLDCTKKNIFKRSLLIEASLNDLCLPTTSVFRIDPNIKEKIPEKRNPVLIEVSDAFIHFVELHYKMLSVIADSKTKFDIKLAENNIII